MKLIRNILLKILGLKRFLKFISSIYISLVKMGFLKKKYPELFFLNEIIKPNDICIDIGANVGYYSIFLSKIIGESGKVLAVEPIPLFAEIWNKNVKRSKIKNLEMYNCALGGTEEIVKMGIPEVNGVLHHGMTKIVSTKEEKYIEYFDVEMKVPDNIFLNLEKLDFIKCDVEGYESEVFSNMKETIRKFNPIIQSELSGNKNRLKVISLLKELGYVPSILNNNKLEKIEEENYLKVSQDFYFIK